MKSIVVIISLMTFHASKKNRLMQLYGRKDDKFVHKQACNYRIQFIVSSSSFISVQNKEKKDRSQVHLRKQIQTHHPCHPTALPSEHPVLHHHQIHSLHRW